MQTSRVHEQDAYEVVMPNGTRMQLRACEEHACVTQ